MRLQVTHAFILALVVTVTAFGISHATLRGDMNGDGRADALDALMILQESAGLMQWARVLRVLDGDTIEVNLDGQPERVRYYSIDAPELDEPGGVEAWEANARLIEGGVVLLLPELGRARDVYGRLLRNVFTPDGEWIEATLVEGGYATWR